MHKLVLIRHGESTWNLENRFTGWTDVDLTPTGLQQAITAGKLLKVEREREERSTYVLEVRAGLPAEALERRCEEVAEQAHRLWEAGPEVGLELPGLRLRPGAGSGQERLLLRALAWVGHEEQREEAA